VRVGGPRMPAGMQASIDSMVRVDASGVVGDNLWLWRADHVQGGGLVRHGENPCDHALVVTGHDVIMYGLAAEHTLKEMVLWSGQRGATFFFQAELPYDVSTYPYAGYTVSPTVRSHNSYGAGVYHFFRDYEVTVQTGIKCPASLEASFVNPLAVFLDGKVSGPLSFLEAVLTEIYLCNVCSCYKILRSATARVRAPCCTLSTATELPPSSQMDQEPLLRGSAPLPAAQRLHPAQ
jgi:hypothetical protein